MNEMHDYTPYVIAVYLLALMVYGGATLLWQARLRQALRHLADSPGDAHDHS